MTYIKLFAGLGNQLFQFSYGQFLISQGQQVRYILRRSLNPFGTFIDVSGVFALPDNSERLIFEPRVLAAPRLAAKKAFAKYIAKDYRTGYYQEAAHVLRSDFAFRREKLYKATAAYEEISACRTSVSLHIRGGDYHDVPQYAGVATPGYYDAAVKYILKKTKKPEFFIFTNDIAFAKETVSTLALKNVHFVSEYRTSHELLADPGYDLFLMSQCAHNIIANSTFSWWGAELNASSQKLVITPEHWRSDTTDADVILRPEWTRVRP